MKTLILITALLAFTGCTQLNSLEVTDNENAFACVKGKTNPIPTVGGTGVMVDVGKTDSTNWTAEQWRTLAEICD